METTTTPRWPGGGGRYLALPKISLHDHLDGSLLPETVVELADAQGFVLPHSDPDTLAGWFQGRVPEPVVEFWDQKFGMTTALMQDVESIVRVAREFVLELAADGVVHGETRWAPEKHVLGGLALDEAVEAVAEGLRQGEQEVAGRGGRTTVRQLLCAMRTSDRSSEIARLAIRHHGASVVGFDLAGEENGYPVTDHLEACAMLHDAGVPSTLHSGEMAGLDSLQPTVHRAHPLRIGHGVRIVEDLSLDGVPLALNTARSLVDAGGPDALARVELGPLASWVRDRRVPLEVCLSSNSKGHVHGRGNHPVGLLHALGFSVTLNPDNRMMSGTCISREMDEAVQEFGWGLEDLRTMTVTALRASFLTLPEQDRLLADVIAPAWDEALRSTPDPAVAQHV